MFNGRPVNLSDRWNPGGQLDPQSLRNSQRRLQGGIAVLAERAVKLLAGKPGLT